MRCISRTLIAALCLAVSPLAVGPLAFAQERVVQGFVHKGVAKDADRYEAYVKEGWKPGGKKPVELISAADRLMPTDARAASRTYAQAVAADSKNAGAWLGLARALLAIKPDENKGSEQYDLPVNASGAAYKAYQFAGDPSSKAKALTVLGEAMQRRSYWRPAIEALKASLAITEEAATRAAYEKLRAEHGFRMTDYSTESEAAAPRICVQFSEALARGQIDFAKFVSLDGKDPQTVAVEGQQVCVDGLAHGQRYEIQIRAGLPSDVGEPLEKDVKVAVYVPDRKPFVRFTGKSYVLPTRGQQGIPVVSVNTARVSLEVYRVGDRSLATALGNGDFDRQLSGYDLETLKDKTGEKIYTGEMDVASKINEDVTTAFPVSEAIGALKPGVYAMIARPSDKTEEDYQGVATQWFIVSDLGLTAFTGQDGIHAFVRSLAETKAVAGANVRLVAKNNEVLATAKTDAQGYAHFEAGLSRGEGGLQPAVVVAENGGTEYAFLDLTANAFDLSDRGVKGRDQPGPIDGFLYTESGVYRPGEEVNVTALVRDANSVAASLPVTLIVVRPDGVEQGRYTLADQGLGGRSLRLPLNGSAQTGTWRVRLHADPKADAITQVSFMVEDYVPERLDMTLEPAAGALVPSEAKTIKLTGRYLYGPPAAGLGVEGDIVVRESKKAVEGFEGYKFGQADEKITAVREPLSGLPNAGDDGIAVLPVELPAITKTAQPLEADIMVRLKEDGGRTIERSVTVPVDLREPRIGIKPAFGETLAEGENAKFEIVYLDEASKRAAVKGLNWELVRLDTSWQWYSRDGSWNYEAQTIKRKVANGTIDTLSDAAATLEAATTYGRYRLDVTAPGAEGVASSVLFTAGWYSGEETADTPEILDIALDKPGYAPGDTAKLRIASKTGGKALVAVLGSGLLSSQEVDIPKGGGDVSIKVGSDWGPGAYATALLYRPMDEAAKRMPSRAMGVQWIGVDQAANTLKVSIEADAKIASASKLSVPLKISGLASGEEARVTVAAVDLGILNLTRYQVPAPEFYFYQQRKLGVDVRDFYGRLIDGMRAERGKIRSGGDGMESEGLKGSPPVEDTVAFYSGIVSVGADGTAEVSFDMPGFNGTVRLMAVAWSKNKLGHGTSDVIVRDAVALTASAPRFITLGDEATLDLSIHNVEGAAGAYKIALSQMPASGLESGIITLLNRDIPLNTGERKGERIAVKPADVGLQTYEVRVTGAGGIDVSRQLTFDVKPPAGDIKRTTVKELSANGGKLTLSKDLVAGLIGSRTTVNLSVGPTARLDVPGLLSALDRYPYGCAEQTVSRALPLVYANAVAASIGIAPDAELKARVQKAVERVFELQDSSGAFGIWGGGSGDLWLTSYVTDFLTRAKETGYDVRTIPFNQALDRLQNFIANAKDFEKGGEDRAYALYVLARNSRAPVGELRYYADTRLDRFASPLAKAQIGAALSMMGDKERAEKAFTAALAMFDALDASKYLARDDYGSALRDGAALVTLASETGISKSEAPRLVNVISKAYLNRTYTSTQEQAWMLLAAKALGDQAKQTKLSLGGKPVTGSILRSLTVEDLEKGLEVTNGGDVPTDAVISVIGASLTPEPAISKGFKIERSYYTLDGKQVDMKSVSGGTSELKQNDRLVAVVKVESDEDHGRVLLVDRLPAGLEIENPRLVDSGSVSTLPWLKSDIAPEHSEFRDDRFVAAFNLGARGPDSSEDGNEGDSSGTSDSSNDTAAEPAKKPGEPEPAASATVAYIVRAVTPGKFIHPAATVEDMYRPERYARTSAGTLSITTK